MPLRVQRGDVVLGDGQHAAGALGREGGEVAAFAECLKKKMKRLRFGSKEQKTFISFFHEMAKLLSEGNWTFIESDGIAHVKRTQIQVILPEKLKY